MQDIEISLYPSKDLESARALQLFGNSQMLRKSCFIKLQFHKIESMNVKTIEACKQMTGFKILTFEIDAPHAIPPHHLGSAASKHFQRCVSALLVSINAILRPTMGPGTFANDHPHRHLIFKPQDHK